MNAPVYLSSLTPHITTVFPAHFENMTSDIIHNKFSYTYRFLVITEGNCTVRLDGGERLCKKGDIIFLCPRQEYSTAFHPKKFVCINVVFGFSCDPGRVPDTGETIDKILCYTNIQPVADYYSEKLSFADMPIFNSSFIVSGMPGAESRIHRMHEMYRDNNKLLRLRLNAELLGFIADICDYTADGTSHAQTVIARRILDYIDGHCEEPLTCGLLSEKFRYHSSYINRAIRGYTGYTPHQCIMRAKVGTATRLLLESSLSITEIAYRLSFCDSSHFCKVYREYTGVKPTDVRCKK